MVTQSKTYHIIYSIAYRCVNIIYRCVKIFHAPDEFNKATCYSSDLNATDKDGHTALHLACLNGHLPVAKHLCAINADLEGWYVVKV